MSQQQQQKPQECRTCKANGFPEQLIIFEQLPGLFWPNGKPKFKPVNPDNSKHEHKPVVAAAQTPAPTINMSESQRKSIDDSPAPTNTILPTSQFDKEEYYRKKEEKYDNNIAQYKQWQDDILREFKYQSTILEDTLTSQKEMAQDIKDMLRILSAQTQEPTIKKASDLLEQPNRKPIEGVGELPWRTVQEAPKSSEHEQHKAFENLDNTVVDELANQIEKEIKEEEEEEEQQQQQQRQRQQQQQQQQQEGYAE